MHTIEARLGSNEVVALVGAPNSGKTTLYNWLTNSKFKTVNYPGATVDYSMGVLAPQFGEGLILMDTPGTYSLFPKSTDEEVTVSALFSHPKVGAIKKVVVVVDGTQLSRHLLLAKQISEAGFSMVMAVTMTDLLRKNKIQIDYSILEKEFACPVIPIEGLLGGGVDKLVDAIRKVKIQQEDPVQLKTWSEAELAAKLQRIQLLSEEVLKDSQVKKIDVLYDLTARWDQILLHPVFGMLIFVGMMFGLFSSIFWLSTPFMKLVDAGFVQLNSGVIALAPENLITDFIGNGVIASFGAVMVFVPQIFILFFGIGLLESSGYLARAATLVDKPFSKLGMSGRSFVPILSGFACAVPAIMATRNISSRRDRWITNFVIPLMTCSARLPVYALLLSFLFLNQPAWKAGIVLSIIYFLSLIIGAIAAAILNSIIKKTGTSLFMMELPLYRRPVLRTLISSTLSRTKSYILKAGPAIFMFSVVVWVGTTFPNYQEKDNHAKLEQSYMGRVGHLIEPVFTPMGGDWRTGVGLISAFAAREVFVSSLAILFNVTNENKEAQSQGLLKSMNEAKAPDGRKLFTVSSVIGLIVFFMIAMQCLSTFVIARKEESAKFAWLQLIAFNVIAYILSVGIVQIMRAISPAL